MQSVDEVCFFEDRLCLRSAQEKERVSEMRIEVPSGLVEVKNMNEVKKHFSDEEIVEIVNRFLNAKEQQKKYRRVFVARQKALLEFARKHGMDIDMLSEQDD